MSNTINTELLERAYEVLQIINDDESMQDVSIKINQAIHLNDLEELHYLLNLYF